MTTIMMMMMMMGPRITRMTTTNNNGPNTGKQARLSIGFRNKLRNHTDKQSNIIGSRK